MWPRKKTRAPALKEHSVEVTRGGGGGGEAGLSCGLHSPMAAAVSIPTSFMVCSLLDDKDTHSRSKPGMTTVLISLDEGPTVAPCGQWWRSAN